jgi:hypothetical protein
MQSCGYEARGSGTRWEKWFWGSLGEVKARGSGGLVGLLVLGFISLVLCNGTLARAFGMFTRFGIAGFLLLSILFKSTGGLVQ